MINISIYALLFLSTNYLPIALGSPNIELIRVFSHWLIQRPEVQDKTSVDVCNLGQKETLARKIMWAVVQSLWALV